MPPPPSSSCISGTNDGVATTTPALSATVTTRKLSSTSTTVNCESNSSNHSSTPTSSSQPTFPYNVTHTTATTTTTRSSPSSPLTPPRGGSTSTPTLYAHHHHHHHHHHQSPPPPPVPVMEVGTTIGGSRGAVQVKEVIIVEESSVAALDAAYEHIPHLDIIELPRGGVSIETSAVGYVQYGIPPETIKDSMRLGIPVPSVYIVPVDRFCREMGPALGVNLAEFEFPAYFNFFVQRKRCTLVLDSLDAERNIQRVFSETLLGPLPFRRKEHPLTHAEEGKRR